MTSSSTTSIPALSAFTEEDRSFLEDLAKPTAGQAAEKIAEDTKSPEEVVYKEAHQAAAFLGAFDPLRLIPSAKEIDLKKLLADCTVSSDGTSSRWTMLSGVRAGVLAEMASSPDRLAQGVEKAKRFLERSGEKADDVTQALLGIVGGQPPKYADFAGMSKEVLAANRAVIGWLDSVDKKLGFDAKGLLVDIENAELLEPFRFLTGFDPKTGGDMFVGREDELRRLRSFVDTLGSDSIYESAQRSVQRMFSSDRRVLCLSGVGGVGKSTLLAKFILQHVDSYGNRERYLGDGKTATLSQFIHDSTAPLEFAYLDFDRSTISAAQPSTLLLEMVRQLGWQLPHARYDLDVLRKRIRQEMERTKREAQVSVLSRVSKERTSTSEEVETLEFDGQELPPELINSSLMSTYLYKVGEILTDDSGAVVSVLLVLDTFEEAQVIGDQAVTRIEAFLEAAQEYVSGLKIVVSGRDEVKGFFRRAERMVITEFSDVASRIAFLEMRGLTRKTASSVAPQVGGRPLALHLAARLVREQGPDAVSLSLTDRFKGLFNKYLIDGILYRRILDHIEDKDVRKLAHPGLVLRRIDTEVLQSVIAPVLGVGEMSNERAMQILAAFKLQKDLVRIEPDGSVTHRTDVREQMLALMGIEEPELVRTLHHSAASYYAARQTNDYNADTRERDRIEEIYHRLSVGDSLEQMPKIWFSKARLGLAKSVDEIADIAGRGTLKVLLGRIPTPEEAGALPGDILREYSTKALASAMAVQDPERAFTILAEYAKYIPAELRKSFEPLALDRSGQWAAASGMFTKLIKDRGADLPQSDALAAADFFERSLGHDWQREMIADMLIKLDERLIDRRNRSFCALASLRLKVRQGVYGKSRISLKENDVAGCESLWPISDTPSINQQWLLTLTNEIDRHGPRVLGTIPVTDSVRGQLTYLKYLLIGEETNPDVADLGVKFCDALSRSEAVGIQSQQLWIESANQSIVSLILRHLVRPPTPQWYVPIACLLRREIGKTVRTSDLYEELLPELPFKASTTLRTTKSLADFLGQLDQLGVLHSCLQCLLVRRQKTIGAPLYEILHAYFEWRQAMFFDVDAWFESFERVHLLIGGRKISEMNTAMEMEM